MIKQITSFIMFIAIFFSFSEFDIKTVKSSECDEYGHFWSDWEEYDYATCTEPGKEYRHCYWCYQEQTRSIPAKGHDWEKWKVLKKSTSYHKGKKERYCQECYEHEVITIPKRPLTSSETKAKKLVNKYLQACKKYDPRVLNKCFHKKSKKYYFYDDSSMNKYLRKHNKRIKWNIKDISVSGSKVKVKVRVRYPNLYKASYNAYLKSYIKYKDGKLNDNNAYNYFWNSYLSNLKKAKKKTKTKTFYITVAKKKGKWKIKKRTQSIVDIAMGRYYEGQDDATTTLAWYVLLSA